MYENIYLPQNQIYEKGIFSQHCHQPSSLTYKYLETQVGLDT